MLAEQRPGQGPQRPDGAPIRNEGYAHFISRGLDRLARNPEVSGAISWFRERVSSMPELEVTRTPLTGKGGWTKEMTPTGEVDKVTGAFFDIPGVQVKITRSDGSTFGWNQPGIIQKESTVTIPAPEGAIDIDVSGFIGILRDSGGNILLTVGQEPFAQTDKHALVRTPVQTSTAKLRSLLEGNPEKDPNLAGILEKVGRGKSPSELFESGEIETFPVAPADPNRISATNVGFVMEVPDTQVHKELEAGGENRWCSPSEVTALIGAGVVNGHTASVFTSIKNL